MTLKKLAKLRHCWFLVYPFSESKDYICFIILIPWNFSIWIVPSIYMNLNNCSFIKNKHYVYLDTL